MEGKNGGFCETKVQGCSWKEWKDRACKCVRGYRGHSLVEAENSNTRVLGESGRRCVRWYESAKLPSVVVKRKNKLIKT